MRWFLPLALLLACDDTTDADAPVDAVAVDARPPDSATPDARPDAALRDARPTDLGRSDAADGTPDAEPDAAPPSCPDPPLLAPDGPLPGRRSPLAGVDEVERPAYEALRDTLLADPGVHFVATWDTTAARYRVEAADARFAFVRTDAGYEVVEGAVADVFPITDPLALAGYDAELAAFANPDEVALDALDYPAGDPRVGFVDGGAHPLPLVRIATLFDAVDAPDAVVDLRPWSAPSPGSHGTLSGLQSRAALAFSGAGVRAGHVVDLPAALVDVAPTVMAALGAPTTAGVGPDGTYADGLHLRRQDGWPLWPLLNCEPVERAVVVLFDGLLASELARTGPDLPVFGAMLANGTVVRTGAVGGFPTVSAPGHMTAGTGLWPGHHGVLHNGFWGRADGARVSPFSILTDVQGALENPQTIFDIYDRAVDPDTETLSAAVERAFGPDAFTVVLNELPFGGADLTTIDLLTGGREKVGITESRAADLLGAGQVETVLRRTDWPVPKLLQLSFVITDSAGESHGPHSDALRAALAETDDRLGRVRDAYAQRDALDGTLFVFVADHGMELQDPSRVVDPAALVAASGVRTRLGAHPLVYLVTLEATRDGTDLRITDRDHGGPVAGATAVCEGCEARTTDADGRTPLAGLVGAVQITHPAYNPRTWQAD